MHFLDCLAIPFFVLLFIILEGLRVCTNLDFFSLGSAIEYSWELNEFPLGLVHRDQGDTLGVRQLLLLLLLLLHPDPAAAGGGLGREEVPRRVAEEVDDETSGPAECSEHAGAPSRDVDVEGILLGLHLEGLIAQCAGGIDGQVLVLHAVAGVSGDVQPAAFADAMAGEADFGPAAHVDVPALGVERAVADGDGGDDEDDGVMQHAVACA